MDIILACILLAALTTATFAASRGAAAGYTWLRTKRPNAPTPFPRMMTRETHWFRAAGIVEMSVRRAADMTAHHVAAARQLEAADYALHCLLGELSQVMATSVVSPLAARAERAPVAMPIPSTAMAA